MNTLEGRVALVTGGTMGIGLACGRILAREGAQVVLTHRWGSADEDAVRASFVGLAGPPPIIVQADCADDADTEALMARLGEVVPGGVDILLSNVAFALRTEDFSAWKRRSLHRSIDYSAWPLAAYTQALHRQFGRYPRYVVGMSSDGPDGFFLNYDFVAMSKAVLETMCRYLAFRLRDAGVRVNVVRSRLVRTESFDATFGEDFHAFLEELGGFEDCYTTPEELGEVVLALCSGHMDAVSGQILMVDHGFRFFDNLMGIAERRRQRAPTPPPSTEETEP